MFKLIPAVPRNSTRTFRTSPTMRAERLTSLRAQFWRGGTSNGLILHKHDLPVDQSDWQPILATAMGSPDYYGRQLNGMGGGISSLSKVCIVEPSKRNDADVDYTFIQVGIKDGSLDMAGNCGNMSSAIAPFAVNEGLVQAPIDLTDSSTTIRIFNTNTSKVIHSTFAVSGTASKFDSQGDYKIAGVPGTGSRIALSFISPGGSKTGKTQPTGNPIDSLSTAQRSSINASLVDVANPGVFLDGRDLNLDPNTTPQSLDSNRSTMDLLERIRREGAKHMGLDPSIGSIPKIVILFPPDTQAASEGVDIICLALSMGQAHKAVPLTLALNLGVAVHLEGTIPHRLARKRPGQSSLVMRHPGGMLEVGASMEGQEARSAILHRTARVLMRGEVNCS